MSKIEWLRVLDLKQALRNVTSEYQGDWHRDPWQWPEYCHVLKYDPSILVDWFEGTGCGPVAQLDVPKENWGIRPAVVLDPIDRLCYQAIVDLNSVKLIGDMAPNAYGWRLIPNRAEAGVYARDSLQWENYRSHLNSAATWFEVALKTDIVSCFASMRPTTVMDEVATLVGTNLTLERLESFLHTFDAMPSRGGLPQRSRASSVLANMVMRHFDDVLQSYATVIPELKISPPGKSTPREKLGYVRWMDDMWLFSQDSSTLRRAQLDLQIIAHSLGLHLNSSKTEALEGEAMVAAATEVELSAIDSGLVAKDEAPLEHLIDQVLVSPDTVGRTRVKFMTSRMMKQGVHYRSAELVQAAHRMPHCADALSRYFASRYTQESLSEWFLSEVVSPWNLLHWPQAQFMGMFKSSKTPSAALITYLEECLADQNTELPLLAIAAQRLSSWKPESARAVISSTISQRTDPHQIRVLSLAALSCKASRRNVKQWLSQHDSNRMTLSLLTKMNFQAPKVHTTYLDRGPT